MSAVMLWTVGTLMLGLSATFGLVGGEDAIKDPKGVGGTVGWWAAFICAIIGALCWRYA